MSREKALTARNDKLTRLKGLLEKAKPKFEEVLPRHMSVNRLTRTAAYVAATNPDLLNCTEVSFLNACMKAAQLGLEPTGEYGGGHFVRFGDQCTFVPDYRGVLDVVRRTGKVDSVRAYVIHENDDYEVDYMANPPVQHRPMLVNDPGKPIAYYAIATLNGSTVPAFEIMRRDEVDAHRRKLRSGNSDAWASHFDRMALKTVLLRLCNLLPRSVEMMLVAESSYQADVEVVSPSAVDIPAEVTEVIVEPPKSRTEEALGRLKPAPEPAPEPEEAHQDNGKLPKMDELRAKADALGVDITDFGRKRTEIYKYLLDKEKEYYESDDEPTPEPEQAPEPEVTSLADPEEVQRVQSALSGRSGLQVGPIVDRCEERGISTDSADWTSDDCNTIIGMVQEAIGAA